jgi:hypothetical protein
MFEHAVLLHLIRSLLCIAVSVPIVRTQEARRSAPQEILSQLPGGLDRHTASLGNRLLDEGKERSVLTGYLTAGTGEHMTLRVMLQLPAMVRIEGLRSDGSALIFDGKTGIYPNSRLEEELLEIFSSDTAEGLLASVKGGSAVQLLGRDVRSVTDRKGTEDSKRFDVYEVSGAIGSSARSVDRLKRYFFDSATGLLSQTQYIDDTFAPPLDVVTEFSDWRIQDGSAYPWQILRTENGRTAFSFAVTSIEALPRLDPINFGASAQTTQRGQQ